MKLNVKHKACSCTDSKGQSKALYLTRADAEKQRKISEKEHHVKLRVYKCDEGKGYHLTHTKKITNANRKAKRTYGKRTKKQNLLKKILSFFFGKR